MSTLTLTRWVRNTYHFFNSQALLAVSLGTLLAFAFFAGRVYFSRNLTYLFLVWNLFLAWIPYLAALWMAAQHRLAPRHWVIHLLPGAVWLAFFPNAPYILTDLLHLTERPPIGIWYDIGLLVTFAFTGCFLGIASLRTVQLIVKDHLGHVVSWLVVCVAIALGGFGVYIGRYLRWNSWDLLFNTAAVARDILNHVLHPLAHARAYGVSLMFAAIFFVAYLMYATTHTTPD